MEIAWAKLKFDIKQAYNNIVLIRNSFSLHYFYFTFWLF